MTSSLVGSEMCIRDSWSPESIVSKCIEEEGCGYSGSESRVTLAKEPVSYTHLTLPTICSV
eukprot:11506547-Prorocentrum_lima.AAC.1